LVGFPEENAPAVDPPTKLQSSDQPGVARVLDEEKKRVEAGGGVMPNSAGVRARTMDLRHGYRLRWAGVAVCKKTLERYLTFRVADTSSRSVNQRIKRERGFRAAFPQARRFLHREVPLLKSFSCLGAVALAALCFLAYPSLAQQIATSTFNQAPARPPEDPAVVGRGKAAYEKYCQQCHSADMRGTETNPNLLRSQHALVDKHGEVLVPIMRGESVDFPGHKTDIDVDDAGAVSAYIRSLLAQIGSQGRAPGDASRQPNIVVGDAERGKQYFAKTCASCHSATGDLSGFAKRVTSPKLLQAAWLRGTYLGAKTPPATVTVTEPGMPPVNGALIHVDDFIVTLQKDDGSVLTFRRIGDTPQVAIHDPLEPHRALLPSYRDEDIHDVTAYLVTLQ
jgi:cytochrome c oxidase cbb3-type subunit III